jgi:S-(hydroxymethyl)glutathione dehydrogenase/alcohol dehydrogenase
MMIMMTAELPFFAGKRLRKGDQEYCQVFGLGSFAEKCVVHKRAAVKVRTDVPSEVACLLGCGTSTGLGAAIHTAGVRPGDTVAIFGCGGVGLSALMGAKLAGAGRLIAVDPAQNSLDMAKELGADILVNPNEVEDVPGKIKELTDGLGVDHGIEAAGNARVMETAFASINNGGKCVVIGMTSMEDLVTLFPAEFLLGKTITGTTQGDIAAQVDIPRFVDMHMDGKLPIDRLITRSYSLDQINDAFEALEKKEVIRSVIKM